MVQSYKNESKSQHAGNLTLNPFRCDVWYKVTKMRANHNLEQKLIVRMMLWCMVQSYKNESKSQLGAARRGSQKGCDVWYKVTKMRANHNALKTVMQNLSAVMYGTKLQKWEQITTIQNDGIMLSTLWCMVQSYKNESKSQPELNKGWLMTGCDVWYKVTKMRANHNIMYLC